MKFMSNAANVTKNSMSTGYVNARCHPESRHRGMRDLTMRRALPSIAIVANVEEMMQALGRLA
jgi:hypothetical protein